MKPTTPPTTTPPYRLWDWHTEECGPDYPGRILITWEPGEMVLGMAGRPLRVLRLVRRRPWRKRWQSTN